MNTWNNGCCICCCCRGPQGPQGLPGRDGLSPAAIYGVNSGSIPMNPYPDTVFRPNKITFIKDITETRYGYQVPYDGIYLLYVYLYCESDSLGEARFYFKVNDNNQPVASAIVSFKDDGQELPYKTTIEKTGMIVLKAGDVIEMHMEWMNEKRIEFTIQSLKIGIAELATHQTGE